MSPSPIRPRAAAVGVPRTPRASAPVYKRHLPFPLDLYRRRRLFPLAKTLALARVAIDDLGRSEPPPCRRSTALLASSSLPGASRRGSEARQPCFLPLPRSAPPDFAHRSAAPPLRSPVAAIACRADPAIGFSASCACSLTQARAETLPGWPFWPVPATPPPPSSPPAAHAAASPPQRTLTIGSKSNGPD